MICVEVANALDDGVVVAPGADHRLAMVVEVAPSEAASPTEDAGPDAL
jgi:hypothetical protein